MYEPYHCDAAVGEISAHMSQGVAISIYFPQGKSRVQTSTPLDHGGSSRLLTRTPLSPVNQQRMMSLTKKVLLGTGADHTGAAPHQTPTGTLGRRAHKRMPGSSDQSAMQHKRPKQLVIDTPSGCLDSWQPCQTPDSQSDSGSEVWSSTPVERYPCRGLLHPPSVSDLSVSCPSHVVASLVHP